MTHGLVFLFFCSVFGNSVTSINFGIFRDKHCTIPVKPGYESRRLVTGPGACISVGSYSQDKFNCCETFVEFTQYPGTLDCRQHPYLGLPTQNRLTTSCEAYDSKSGLIYKKLVNYSTPCSQSFDYGQGITVAQCLDPNLDHSDIPKVFSVENHDSSALPIFIFAALLVLLVVGSVAWFSPVNLGDCSELSPLFLTFESDEVEASYWSHCGPREKMIVRGTAILLCVSDFGVLSVAPPSLTHISQFAIISVAWGLVRVVSTIASFFDRRNRSKRLFFQVISCVAMALGLLRTLFVVYGCARDTRLGVFQECPVLPSEMRNPAMWTEGSEGFTYLFYTCWFPFLMKFGFRVEFRYIALFSSLFPFLYAIVCPAPLIWFLLKYLQFLTMFFWGLWTVWSTERTEKLLFLRTLHIKRSNENSERMFRDAGTPMVRVDTDGVMLSWNKVPHTFSDLRCSLL
jgi:hypothetical protein